MKLEGSVQFYWLFSQIVRSKTLDHKTGNGYITSNFTSPSTNHSRYLKPFHNSTRDLLAIIVLRVLLQTYISMTKQEI